MEKEISYKFLNNIPIGKDLFEGQSQEKIANVVSENITNGGFQIIGIDGGWGTGKSNLVKIIEEKLIQKKKNYKFFIYDVWGHQEDDQRKAILVELTEFITENKQIKDTKKWEDKLVKLLAKEREITTLNFPYLSIGFIFSLLSIVYIPTINVFKDSMTDFFGIEKFIWKLLLITFPLFILLGIYVWNFFKSWINGKQFWKSFKLSAQETFQIYTNKQTEETKVETISEKEPSVRDFRNWMKDIDSDLGKNMKNLIIVFDNFDRLPKKYIQSIWSSIHIFFSEEKYENINVIIPFDRAHIKNSFCDLNPMGKDDKKVDYANDYINKTFDIVFRIAPPIMSAWKDFFKKCWDEALGNSINEEEYIRIEQIYEAHAPTITPREIIAFINEVISLKLLHKDIPEQYLGLFVINKDSILSDPLRAITEPFFLKGLDYLYKDSDDFQKYITALAYQIDSVNALEVIYKKQLKDSLLNNETEKFLEISKTKIFSRIIFSVIADFEDFENPILTLNSLNKDSDITTKQEQSLWDNIYLKNKIKVRENVQVSDGEYILLTKISSKYKDKWIKAIIDILLNHTNEFNPTKYAGVVDKFNNLIKDNSISIDIFKILKSKKVESQAFLDLVENKKDLYSKYKITTENETLDKYLSEQDIPYFENSNFLKHLIGNYSFTSFIASIKEKITENKTDIKNLSTLFKVLRVISKSSPRIGLLLTDAEIYTLFTKADIEDEFYYDLIAMRIARGSDYHNSYKAQFTEILNKGEEHTVKKVSEVLEDYINYGDFLVKSLSFSNTFVQLVVQNITENRYQQHTANIKTLIESFEEICETNNLNPQVFITTLSRWDNPTFEKEFIESLSNYFVTESFESDTKLAQYTISEIQSYYDNLTQEEWKNIFEDLESNLYNKTLIIKYSNWSSYALEALKAVLIQLCQTGNIENETTLQELILNFETANKDLTNTFKNIRDEFIRNGNMDTTLFSFFSSWLFKYATLEERTGDVMRTIIIPSLLDDELCLDKIISNKEKVKQLIDNASQSETFDFKEAIRDRMENETIKNLAKYLGIGKRKEKKEDKEQEETE